MELTLRGETINIELGQEVTFYRYIFNNENKIVVEEDKVIVDIINENVIGFKNKTHGATLRYYEMNNFYLSNNKKNLLDFITRRHRYYEKRKEQLKREIDDLDKQIEKLNSDKAHLETLIENIKKDN